MGNREIHEALAGLHAGPEMHRMAERMRDFAGGPGFGLRAGPGSDAGRADGCAAAACRQPSWRCSSSNRCTATRSSRSWRRGAAAHGHPAQGRSIRRLSRWKSRDWPLASSRTTSASTQSRIRAVNSPSTASATATRPGMRRPRPHARASTCGSQSCRCSRLPNRLAEPARTSRSAKVVELVDQARKQVYLIPRRVIGGDLRRPYSALFG